MQNEVKIRLIDNLEKQLGIHLQPKQLEFLFSDASVTILTAPRRYGKDTISAIKIALTILENEQYKIGVILPNKILCQLFFDKLKDIFDIMLPGFIKKATKNPRRLEAINGSLVSIFYENNQMKGHRLHEAYILEFYDLRDFLDTYNILTVSLLWNTNYKINLIGTPEVITSDFVYELLREREDRNHLRVGMHY